MKETQTQLAKHFPIESQTTPNDRKFLLASIVLVSGLKQHYSYVEIGAYLGGSLTPFLLDANCTWVLSIDERGRQQPDERGAKFDYTGVTHRTMIDKLTEHGISTDKLQTFDGSVDTFGPSAQTFDVAFIDGEHTDVACVRDFLWLLPMMKPDAVVMFHDSTLVFKALRIIQLYLRKLGLPFRFMKKTDSAMSAIFLGRFSQADIAAIFGPEENADEFYASSETALIHQQIKNRVKVRFTYEITPPMTISSF